MRRGFMQIALLSTLGPCLPLYAEQPAQPDTLGGGLMSRPRLTGNWLGLRDDMARKGVTLDVDLYWMPQTITSGGKDDAGGSWGNATATLELDTGKAGLWAGGHFKVQTVSSFGNNIMQETGALVPANITWMLPSPTKTDTGVQELSYTQLFSQKFGVTVGKLNSIAPTNVLHGDYYTGFQNTALNLPLAMALVPLSAYGVGAIYLPTHDLTFAAMVLDPNGTIMDNDLGSAFSDGVMTVAAMDMKVKPWALPGHQNLTLAWSNKTRNSLTQDPGNLAAFLLTTRFPRLGDPGPVLGEILAQQPGIPTSSQPLNTESRTWSAVYSFEQFLWQPEGAPDRGVGVFFSAGVSDGKANPVKASFSLGVVGKGMVPGRPNDEFGIGWARTKFSDNFVPFLRNNFSLGLQHEDVLEIYYIAPLTPWLTVSPSLQIISPAMNKVVGANNEFQNLNTSYIAGVRFGVRF